MISMHGKVWKSLVSLPAFRDILTSYLKLPWHKLHTSQVADFQIWDKALSDDELLKVIMQFVAKMIHIVDREFRVATHWWTLCENYLLRQYCGIFQWSKDYNGSLTSQTIFCPKMKILTSLLHFYADGRMWSFLHIPLTKVQKNAKKTQMPPRCFRYKASPGDRVREIPSGQLSRLGDHKLVPQLLPWHGIFTNHE